MTATVNGWRVITRAECRVIDVPGGQVPVHPALAVIFTDVLTQVHQHVEPLVFPGTWGWSEPRPVRGKTGGTPTNHASGTAVDASATKHPQGVPVGKTFTPDQLEEIRGVILPRYHGLITWGGDWRGADVDGMHWELTNGATPAQVGALEATLLSMPVGPPDPAPAPPAPAGWTGPDLRGSGINLRGEAGNNGPRVQALQSWLLVNFPAYARDGLAPEGADGWWGPHLTAVLREYAARSGVRGALGDNVGPQIARRLYLSGARF